MTAVPKTADEKHSQVRILLLAFFAEMSEWIMVPVLKTGDDFSSVGSNPTFGVNFLDFST